MDKYKNLAEPDLNNSYEKKRNLEYLKLEEGLKDKPKSKVYSSDLIEVINTSKESIKENKAENRQKCLEIIQMEINNEINKKSLDLIINENNYLDQNVVSIKNIHKTYLIGIEGVPALRGVSLKVKKGEFLVILGTSGGGKTSLLNLIGTIDQPSRVENFELFLKLK